PRHPRVRSPHCKYFRESKTRVAWVPASPPGNYLSPKREGTCLRRKSIAYILGSLFSSLNSIKLERNIQTQSEVSRGWAWTVIGMPFRIPKIPFWCIKGYVSNISIQPQILHTQLLGKCGGDSIGQ